MNPYPGLIHRAQIGSTNFVYSIFMNVLCSLTLELKSRNRMSDKVTLNVFKNVLRTIERQFWKSIYMRLQKWFFLIASCMLSRAQIDGENQGLLRRKTFYLFFFLLSFAEISLHRILGTDRFRTRSMIISSYNMLTALPARLQLLST